jgi:pyruvate-formate lyase-activating enzyme
MVLEFQTTVLLKACSLRCKWCSNPETIHPKPELAFKRSNCIGAKECGPCLKPPCPEGAMYVIEGPDDKVHINWELANGHGDELASVCPTGPLYIFGHEMTVDEVLATLKRTVSSSLNPAEALLSLAASASSNLILSRRFYQKRTIEASTLQLRLRVMFPFA